MAKQSLVVFGDSVTWGQGHLAENKFVHLVAEKLGLDVKMHAHSGATIGVGDMHQGRCGPEAPNHYPTVLQQLAAATEDPGDTGLVIIDGGINDVSVDTILNPFTLDAYLRHKTRRYCYDDMRVLLEQTVNRFPSEKTPIVVTSFFPIFSHDSKLPQVLSYLAARAMAPPPMVRTESELRAFAFHSVELALIFWKESRARLQQAVDATGSSRVMFADVPYQEENAMFASDPWLFNVRFEDLQVVPEDDVIERRHEECVLCHRNRPFQIAICDIASAGHPNRPGSQEFAKTILSLLK